MLQSYSRINPFSKKYSNQSILKRNYQYIAQKNHIKVEVDEQSVQKQNKNVSKIFQNPFQKSLPLTSRINKFYYKQFQTHNNKINSHQRSKFESLDRNRNYKGLTAQNNKNFWKRELQKTQRQKLKNWGVQALRYKPQTSYDIRQQKFQYNQGLFSNNSKRNSKISSDVMDQYYGQSNEYAFQDKPKPLKLRTAIKKKSYNNQENQQSQHKKVKGFDVQSSIPESADQDNYTRHFIADKLNKISSFDTIKENQSKIDLKRNSIQHFKNSFNGDSRSSGFYASSNDMFQSGPSNFKLMNKKGPLNTSQLDQQSQQEDLYNSPNFNQRKSNSDSYPSVISYSQRLYFKIQLKNE